MRQRHGLVRFLAVCGVLICLADRGLAQERPGSIYVVGGVVAPYQADGSGRSYFGAPGGRTASWLAGGGVFVAPRVSIEGEFWSTGVMSSVQQFRSNWLDSSRGPDRFVTVGVKWQLASYKALRFEPVGGIVVTLPGEVSGVHSDAEGRPESMFTMDPYPGMGFMFGGDLRIGGRHFAVVPSLRFVLTGEPYGSYASCDPDANRCGSPFNQGISRVYLGGYPSWTQRPSLSLMVSF